MMKFYKLALCIYSLIINQHGSLAGSFKKSHPLEKIIGGYVPEDVGSYAREIFYNKIDKLASRFDIDQKDKSNDSI